MEKQEYMIRLQMLQQEAEKIEQQVQAIDQQINELGGIRESIEALSTKKDKELLANIGKGIFVKTELKEEEMFVNVGRGIMVKKTADDTKRIIEEQTKKMFEAKESFMVRIQEIQEQMQNLIMEIQNSNHEHSCGNEDCECEEPCEDCSCEKN
jgi:prefoldin alpha subunit